MMCNVLKLSLLERDKETQANRLLFVFKWAWIQRDVLARESERFLKERNKMWERGSLVSMVYRNWQTNKASVMSKNLKKKNISTGKMEDLGFDFVLSLGWRNSRSSHLPVWKESEESDSFCQQEKKKTRRKRRGVTGELVGGREGGRTGRHCVSSSPFYSFTLVPFWPLGGMVTEEGVRNVLLLGGCHL